MLMTGIDKAFGTVGALGQRIAAVTEYGLVARCKMLQRPAQRQLIQAALKPDFAAQCGRHLAHHARVDTSATTEQYLASGTKVNVANELCCTKLADKKSTDMMRLIGRRVRETPLEELYSLLPVFKLV